MTYIEKIKTDVKNVESKLDHIKNMLESISPESTISNDSFIINGVIPLDLVIDNYIKYAINKCDGNQTMCAELLGRSRSTLWRMITNMENAK